MTPHSGGDKKVASVYPPFSGTQAVPGGRTLPSIEDFLDDLPLIDAFAESPVLEDAYNAGFDDDYYEGFREDYDSEFPLLDESAAAESLSDYPLATRANFETGESVAEESVVDGWAVDDWQRYDWSSISSLGRQSADRAAADAEWGATEWISAGVEGSDDRQGKTFTSRPGPGPQEVAIALDDIARRIRSGELLIDQFGGSPPETAMAAVLAALLRTRG